MSDDPRQIEIEYVAIPTIAGFGEEFRGRGFRRAARRQPATHRFPGSFSEKLGAACDVSLLLFVGEKRRDHVHCVGVRQHLVASIGDGAHRCRRAFGNDGIHHHARLGAMTGKPLHQAVDTDLDAISGPRDRHRVERAGGKRIAHRTDARRFAVGPSFQADIEHNGDAFAARPGPVRPFPVGCCFHWRPRGAKCSAGLFAIMLYELAL